MISQGGVTCPRETCWQEELDHLLGSTDDEGKRSLVAKSVRLVIRPVELSGRAHALMSWAPADGIPDSLWVPVFLTSGGASVVSRGGQFGDSHLLVIRQVTVG